MAANEPREYNTPLARPKRVRLADRPSIAAQIENLPPVAKSVVTPPSNRPLTDSEYRLFECMELHQAEMKRAIRRYVDGFDAEGIVVDVFHRFSEIDTIGWDAARQRGWLIMNAKRKAVEFLRKEASEVARWQVLGSAGLVPVDLSTATERNVARWRGRDADDQLAQDILRDRVELIDAVLDQLPTRKREFFVDYHIEGVPAKELAEQEGIAVRTVNDRLNRTLAEMKERILRENPYD
jgi:RNA polymerase sigma factor (sigma-70 family)